MIQDRVESFNQFQPLLFSIAYRMLGSAMDAEDMVQEAFLRWQNADLEEIQSAKAFLTTVITRLCIDHWRLARVQRESYIGPWLPEPILGGPPAGIGDAVAMRDSLSMAFLVLLESLSPVERAVFLLREVFDYDYAEIAAIVDKTEANCRQMFKRAKDHITSHRPRHAVSPAHHEQIFMQFVQACSEGDMDGLLALLDKDIVNWSDGGGKVSAAINLIYGPDRVARLLLTTLRKLASTLIFKVSEINGQPGILAYQADGTPYLAMVLDSEDGRIRGTYYVMNPDKLKKIPPYSPNDSPAIRMPERSDDL